MHVYPIFLNDLAGRRCVVVGGGHEAERKAQGLLDAGAAVTLIGPEGTPTLRRWAASGRITWIARGYRPGDLRDAFLVIVSEADPDAAEALWQEAQAEKALINTMDDVPRCTFVAGSVVRRGPLVVSISTSGCAPALAVRLRQRLEQIFDPDYASFLEMLGSLRPAMAARFPDFEERRHRWYALVDAVLPDVLRAGDLAAARRRVEDIIGAPVPAAAGT